MRARMPKSEGSKRFRERHKQLGLCIWCSRKAKTGMLRCQVCLARMRERWRARHPLSCTECGKEIKREEKIRRRFHKLCAQKRRARTYPLVHTSAVIAYQERHRELGLCTSCPRKVFKGSLCRKHYRTAQERYYERAAG